MQLADLPSRDVAEIKQEMLEEVTIVMTPMLLSVDVLYSTSIYCSDIFPKNSQAVGFFANFNQLDHLSGIYFKLLQALV